MVDQRVVGYPDAGPARQAEQVGLLAAPLKPDAERVAEAERDVRHARKAVERKDALLAEARKNLPLQLLHVAHFDAQQLGRAHRAQRRVCRHRPRKSLAAVHHNIEERLHKPLEADQEEVRAASAARNKLWREARRNQSLKSHRLLLCFGESTLKRGIKSFNLKLFLLLAETKTKKKKLTNEIPTTSEITDAAAQCFALKTK